MKTCRTCRLAALAQNRCQLTGLPISADDFCSRHTTEALGVCHSCRRPLLPEGTILVKGNDSYLTFCQECASKLSSCALCLKAETCEFETNPEPMPKVTVQQVRKDNMVMQVQIRNPERIKKFCHSCSCWDAEEGFCYKEYGIGCIKHESVFSHEKSSNTQTGEV